MLSVLRHDGWTTDGNILVILALLAWNSYMLFVSFDEEY